MLRAIDRYNLIDASSHLMGDRMDYDDVQIYLRPFQIDINNDVFERRSFSSSYQYAKTILNYAEDEVVIEIANQLGVETALLQSTDATSDFDCWIPGHFRLFVSHVSADKETAKRLSDALRLFGISAFVAHADIKPGREWEVEIEQALRSMHALTAILGPGFRDSDWCDQEVGAAVGLGHLVVPLLRDAEPYGFFAKFQGIRTNGMSVGSVAKSVFSALATSDRTRTRLSDALVSKVLFSDTPYEAVMVLGLLKDFSPSMPSLERLRNNIVNRKELIGSVAVRDTLDQLLQANGIAPLVFFEESEVEDDIPF